MRNDYYVYALRREDSQLPFYIGKGSNDRARCHFTESSLKCKNYKNNTIKSAQAAGVEVLVDFLCVKMTEPEAFALEEYLIRRLGRKNKGTGILTNLTDGGDGSTGAVLPPRTKEHREAISKGNKALPKKECPHCGKLAAPTHYASYHGNRCKHNPDSGISSHAKESLTGENSHFAKMTEEKVRQIRKLKASGTSTAELVVLYNISETQVCRIVKGTSWRHVS